MAVGAGVRVSPSPSSMEVWGRRRRRTGTVTARRGAAVAIRCSFVGEAGVGASGGLAEEHYRTLRLRPGSTRNEVKKAFRRLALVYHPDVCKDSDRDTGVEFQKINIAYHILMNNMREAEERLEYWRLKYGLTDQDLDRYRYFLNEDDDDDWLDM
ncbi:chaperone protein dnaJ 8, chloroplastic-like [Miscanthus floridulus]|uniref:chaperone protein dnaJ 8, chloroplastic-like n=1 Tax=Miscanthus floridulus TaxID=154761 RepID=UPI003457B78B